MLLFLVFTSCKQDNVAPLEPLDLTLYELPITIQAPLEAEVKSTTLGYIKDVSIEKGKDFNVQIFASDVRTNNVQNIKQELQQEVERQIYYDTVVEDYEDGFIYRTVVDSSESYGFRHVIVRGDYEIIFQQGLAGTFNLDAVQRMYQAIQQED